MAKCKNKLCDSRAEYGNQCRECYERNSALSQWGDGVKPNLDDYLEEVDGFREYEDVRLGDYVGREMKKTSRPYE